MRGQPDESYPNRIFVEGADDFHVICALVQKCGIGKDGSDRRLPYAPKANGDKEALKKACTAVKAGHRRVGLVLDADADPAARWSEVCRRFDGLDGIALPRSYPPEGVVVDGDLDRRVGVWLMPGGNRKGAVEAFLSSLIPAGELWEHAGRATLEARQKGATFGDKDVEKARLRAWLSWQKTPGAPYGRAIQEGYLTSSSAEADLLVAWFRTLFDLP